MVGGGVVGCLLFVVGCGLLVDYKKHRAMSSYMEPHIRSLYPGLLPYNKS